MCLILKFLFFVSVWFYLFNLSPFALGPLCSVLFFIAAMSVTCKTIGCRFGHRDSKKPYYPTPTASCQAQAWGTKVKVVWSVLDMREFAICIMHAKAIWNLFKITLLGIIWWWSPIVFFCHLPWRGVQCVNCKLSSVLRGVEWVHGLFLFPFLLGKM